MSSDSNPNPRNPVNPTAEDPTPSEQQSDAVVSPEAGEESTESNGVVFRDSAGVGAGDSGDGAEGLKDRSSAVLEGSGELSGGDLGESGVVISEVDLGIDSGADVIGKLSGRRDSCGVLKELGSSGEAEESRELNSVVKEEIPRDLDTGVGEELGELRSIEVGDEVVEELAGGGNLDEVTEELGSSVQAEVDEETNDVNGAVSGDSATEVERELRESKKLGRVHLVSSGVELPAAHSQGDVKREGLGVEDNNVVDSRETGNLERDQKDFDSGIEAEVAAGTSELSGVILEEIPRDLATEVAEELKEPRQIGRVDLGKSDGETLAVDSQGSVSGNLRFGVASREQEFLEGEVVELRNSAEKGEMVFGRTCSELEVEEVPLSPNSSGYAGERGSSSSGGGGSETDEIQESRSVDFVEGDHGVSASGSQGSYGNGHKDEDDASISWRKRKKHFLILSHSGKPIFSRYGDEHKLAGFSATLQAIISFVENGRDRVKSVRAGNHQVVFLVKGPIYLVCISCTEEPYGSLKEQLELLYGQMILILTKSVNKCFEKNSKFDMTPLLGGTDVVFSSLIHSFNWNPATFLHAYTCVPLPYATRQAVGAILQEIANSGILFSLIMCKHKVVSLAGAQKASLHPDDMLLLANFVVSSESFRTSEAFSPICLPRYNPFAFLHAYVHYFDEDIYLMMLTTSSNAFYHLKDCRLRIEEVLLKSNVLSEVHRSMMDGGMRIEDFPVDRLPRSRSLSHLGHHEVPSDSLERHRGPTSGFDDAAGLMHFMYRSIYLEQYVSSEFASPINSFPQQKRLYRAYQKLYLSVHHRETGPHKTHFRRDENYVLLCWVTQEFEFYAAFDPLADKAAAIKICNRVCQWVKDVETDIFLLGGNSFSW